MTKIRLGIVGYGNMGSGHVRNMLMGALEEWTLTAICDIRPERIEACKRDVADHFSDVHYFDDFAEMLEEHVCEAILIATPHYLHPPMAIEALEAGYHVMVEKPAGVYTEAVREMNAAADQRPQQIFGLMFNQRTNPIYKKMKELVQSGELGPIRRTNWIITNWYRSQSYYDSGSWRATWAGEGGGVLLNQCPHNLDLWQWIVGMPATVHAFAHEGKWHDIEVEDDVTCYVEYPNGATGVFVTTTGDAPGTNRFEIMLDGGKLVATEHELTIYRLETPNSQFNREYQGGFGEPHHTVEVYQPDEENPQHVGVMRAFAQAIRGEGELVAKGQDGIYGLTLSNAMHLSSWTGETIQLPLDEARFLEELNRRRETSRYSSEDTSSQTLNTEGSY